MSTAVVINLRARRGSRDLADEVRAHLPNARVASTRTLDEAKAFVAELQSAEDRPSLIVSGGGDGTAVSLLNEWDRSGQRLPTIGLLPLGTGNGWARATGSPSFRNALRRLAAHSGAWPTRSFALVEVEGMLSPWAGTGWDAEILADYHKVVRALPRGADEYIGGFPLYMVSLFGKTVPRMVMAPRTNVRLINLGAPALGIDENGAPTPVLDGEAGAVLYEGPLSVCGCSTTRDLGLGFRAFPFAHARSGRMATRIYSETTLRASRNVRKLWRGHHPLPNDAHWLLDACRMEFDRPVNFEIGGDVVGERTSVEFRLADKRATLLDWSRLPRNAA
jgi:diacylglycerol kinase family enzyme